MMTGGCFCGLVRYEAGGEPFDEANCHCSICRRTSGAAFLAWFSVRRSDFRFVHGTPRVFRSTAKGTRRFCPRCGTHLTFEDDNLPDQIDLTICSLDEPDSVAPKVHIHTESRLAWIKLADGLPEYAASRGAPPRQT